MKIFTLTGDPEDVEKALKVISEKGKIGIVRVTERGFDAECRDVSISMPPDFDMLIDFLAFLGVDYAIFKEEYDDIKLIRADDPDLVVKIDNLEDYETVMSLVGKIRKNPDFGRVGAVGTFTGVVRGIEDDENVLYLEFESYDEITRNKLGEIEKELKQREGVVDVKIFHKTGKVMAGEDIVHVVVAGSHRKEVFSTLVDSMELVKKIVPIWKKEVLESGERWAHEKDR